MFPVQRLPRSSWNVVTACKVGSAPLVKALGRRLSPWGRRWLPWGPTSVSPRGKAGVRSQGSVSSFHSQIHWICSGVRL